MKASDLLRKTTITPDDDPRSKLRDEEEEDTELDPKEEEEVREHETFEDEKLESDDKISEDDESAENSSLDKEDEQEIEEDEAGLDEEKEQPLDREDQEKEESVEPKHTFRRVSEGSPTPKYHNIAGFSAVDRNQDADFETEDVKREEVVSSKGETLEDLAAMPDAEVEEEAMQKKPVDLEEENMDIPNLKSQHIPSSGIYNSHNGAQREFSTFSPPPRRGKSKNLLLQLAVLSVIGLSVIGGTVYALKMQFKGMNTDPSPSPSLEASIPSPTPSPSPEVSIDRSAYKVRVLNGTSTSGLAATVMAKLKELGYQTDRTGNATNSAFTQTQIRIKPSAIDVVAQLIRDLAPDRKAASSSSALKASDAADIEIILGTE